MKGRTTWQEHHQGKDRGRRPRRRRADPGEFADGAYKGAINIPLSVLPARMNELEPKDKPIVLYCASGARSGQGARFLKQAGFNDVVNAGGLDDMPR